MSEKPKHNFLCDVDPETGTYKRPVAKGETYFICQDCIGKALPKIEVTDPVTYFSIKSTGTRTLKAMAAAVSRELEARGEI